MEDAYGGLSQRMLESIASFGSSHPEFPWPLPSGIEQQDTVFVRENAGAFLMASFTASVLLSMTSNVFSIW